MGQTSDMGRHGDGVFVYRVTSIFYIFFQNVPSNPIYKNSVPVSARVCMSADSCSEKGEKMDKRVIAIFGGSFNPTTVAHINLAKQIIENIDNVEKVIFVPVSTKYNKSGLARDEDRFSMLNTICKNEGKLEVTSIELDSNRQLYTIETLEKLQEQNPDYDIYFVLGTDNLKEIETWHTSGRLLRNFKVIVLERDNDVMEEIIENNNFLRQYKNSFIKLNNIEKIDLSASYIRELVQNNKDISGLVPKQIENKVKELYK